MNVSRRTFLTGAATCGAGISALPAAARAGPGLLERLRSGAHPHPPETADMPGLRQIAGARGILFGCAIEPADVRFQRDLATAILTESAIVAPENAMKWEVMEARSGIVDPSAGDATMSVGASLGQYVRGHNLIWPGRLPDWVPENLETARAEQLLERRITATVERWRGRLLHWDVVNEAVAPEHGRADGLRHCRMMDGLGPHYLDLAFHLANQADPYVPLIYNDYGFEEAGPAGDRRRAAVLALLEGFATRKVPCHGLGVEGHLTVGRTADERTLRHFFAEVAAMGFRIQITELDVNDRPVSGSDARRDQKVADETERFLDIALDQPAVQMVMTWGLTQRHSWLNTTPEFKRTDGRRTRGLPLDEKMQRTAMWYALARAFNAAPVRNA